MSATPTTEAAARARRKRIIRVAQVGFSVAMAVVGLPHSSLVSSRPRRRRPWRCHRQEPVEGLHGVRLEDLG
jgi:hypothetical protein